MKKTESKPENVTETDPASPPRLVELETILEPLNLALESVRVEANNLAAARLAHESKLDSLKAQKANLEEKFKALQGFELDVASDPTELALETTGTKDGITLLQRRLKEAEKGVPADASLQNAWRGFVAEFDALTLRIIDLHVSQAYEALKKIVWLPSESFGQRQADYTCGWCGHPGSVRIEIPTNRNIVHQAHTVLRAECLNLRNRQPAEGFIEIVAEGIADLRKELELIADLSALPAYEKPAVPVPVAPVVSKPASIPKPQRGVDARPPDFKTALHPMGRGMLDQAREAEERNAEELKAWEKAGILPKGVRGSLQVNAFMPKK